MMDSRNTAHPAWLTSRRLRVHGLILAICLWSTYAWILSSPGLLDRNRIVKGADFLHSRLPGIALAALFPGSTRSGLPDFQASTRACNRLCNPWDRRMDDRVGRAARRTRTALGGMALLRNVRNAGLLPPPRSCAQPVFSTGTATVPDAFPAILLGDARSLAASGIRPVCHYRCRGTRDDPLLLENTRLAEFEICSPPDCHRARVAACDRFRSGDPGARILVVGGLDCGRWNSFGPESRNVALSRLRASALRPLVHLDAPAALSARDGSDSVDDLSSY